MSNNIDIFIQQETCRPAPWQQGANIDLATFLLSQQVLSPDQLLTCRWYQDKHKMGFIPSLWALNFVPAGWLRHYLAQFYQLPIYKEGAYLIQKSFLSDLEELITTHYVMPLSFDEEAMAYVTTDPTNLVAQQALQEHFRDATTFLPVLTTPEELAYLWRENAPRIAWPRVLEDLSVTDMALQEGEGHASYEVHNFLKKLLRDAFLAKASDIHLSPKEHYVTITYRIDGAWQRVLTIPLLFWQALCNAIKLHGNMDIAIQRVPQSGHMFMHFALHKVDVRIASHPTLHGENIVIRLLDPLNGQRSIESLGLTPYQQQQVIEMVRQPQGILIVSGPTGVGKTTTLYAILNYLARQGLNVMTLEDPVEYDMPGIQQTSLADTAHMSYGAGIRSLMRQDPDVLMIGEIRDEETAQMAFRAAMTGHKVLTTLHTFDAFGVISRLRDLGISNHFISDMVTGIIAQRLARQPCPDCESGSSRSCKNSTVLMPYVMNQSGCKTCHGKGYSGRLGLFEILPVDNALRDFLGNGPSEQALRMYGRQKGFKSFAQLAKALAQAGKITAQEQMRLFGDPQEAVRFKVRN